MGRLGATRARHGSVEGSRPGQHVTRNSNKEAHSVQAKANMELSIKAQPDRVYSNEGVECVLKTFEFNLVCIQNSHQLDRSVVFAGVKKAKNVSGYKGTWARSLNNNSLTPQHNSPCSDQQLPSNDHGRHQPAPPKTGPHHPYLFLHPLTVSKLYHGESLNEYIIYHIP